MKSSCTRIGSYASHHVCITPVFSVVAALSTSLILLINFRNPDLFRSVGDVDCFSLCSKCSCTDSAAASTPPPWPVQLGHDFRTSSLLRAGLIAHSPFRTVGCSSHAFVVTAAYRGGPARWTVIGLQPSHVYRYTPGTAKFQCEWIDGPASANSTPVRTVRVNVEKPGGGMFPHTYITVVVMCDFPVPVGVDGGGGAIVLRVLGPRAGNGAWGWSGEAEEDEWMYAQLRELYTRRGTINAAVVQALSAEFMNSSPPPSLDEGSDEDEQLEEAGLAVVAGTERSQEYDPAHFNRVLYDNLYCGSSIYGELDVLAVNEWLSYHLYLFGDRSHFVLYDAGAVRGNKEMEKALEHWLQLGLVTINRLVEVQMYPGYYHHQHHAINDCLNKYRFQANRIWFMDVDEYIIVKPPHTLHSLMEAYQDQDVLMLKQHKFSDMLCRRLPPQGSQQPHRIGKVTQDAGGPEQQASWTIERLLFSKPPDTIAERKYVVLNPGNSRIRSVLVHAATTWKNHHVKELDLETEAGFYHYHDTVTKKKTQLCGTWVAPDATHGKANSTPHPQVLYDWYYDDAILPLAAAAKTFIRSYLADRNFTSLV